MKVEGLPRHSSTHAAGVLISKEEVTKYVPLSRNKDVITTQFNMVELEELGLLKDVYKRQEYAVVGTINLDFRSLYLHFECGVWMYNTASVGQVKESILEALKISRQVEKEDIKKTAKIKKIVRTVLRIFAPLM